MQVRLVIFDMDGVLILSKRAYLAAFRKELAPYGIRYTERMLDEYEANPRNVNAHWAVVEQALPAGKKKEASKVAKRVERFLSLNWKRYCTSPRGTVGAISRLKKAGMKVAVATHANRRYRCFPSGVMSRRHSLPANRTRHEGIRQDRPRR